MAILNMNYSVSGSGGGNIGEPLNLTVTSAGLDATITWEDNEIGTIPPTTFQKSELVRKIGSAPTSPSDGDLVVTETVKDTYKVSGCVDSGLTDGETYYYRVFSYSDLGGISYCDAVSVTISGGGWQPGANTIAYYPFTTDFDDYSGNGYDLSNYGNVSITTVNGVTCAEFGATAPYGLYASGSVIQNGVYTYLGWINWTEDSSCAAARIFGGTGSWFILYDNDSRFRKFAPQYNAQNGAPYTSGWHLYCFVGDLSTGAFDSYKDGVYVDSGVGTTGAKSGIRIGGNEGNASVVSDRFIGYMGAIVFENKQRTAQEIADYFDQTKGNYGIS